MKLKQIEEFPEYYVSDNGKIFSDKTNKYKSRHKWQELKGFVNRSGYKYVDLVDGKRHKRYGVHQLVAKYFCKGYFIGAVVDHIDANKLNNDYKNLQYISQRDNVVKSYTDSSLDQIRNYKKYKLISPNGEVYVFNKGFEEVKQFVAKNNINISPLSLRYYKETKGWILKSFNKNEVII